jgi:hypothetical protein
MTPDELQQLLQGMPEPRPVFWRLYYDADGKPVQYSMEDLPGTYIDVDPTTYALGNINVRVRDGILVEIFFQVTNKLVPGNSGFPCHPDNVAVIVAEDQPHTKWSKKTYESN